MLAVESLCAAQALDFRAPLRPGRGVQLAHRALRGEIKHAHEDYEVGQDIERCARLLRSGTLADAALSAAKLV